MARSTQYFYDLLIAEKQQFSSLNGLTPISDTNQQLLNDLSSNNKVAVWRLFLWIFAYGFHVIDTLFDHHKNEIETIMNSKVPGTIQWLRNEIFKFQYGYNLTWIDNKYQYTQIDNNARIVKYCSISQVGNQVRIKVAKEVNDMPAPLNLNEYNALVNYVEQIKFAGTNSVITSTQPDKLKLQVTIKYNPQVLNGNGELLSNPSIKPVENAINTYLKSLTFDGKVLKNTLIDFIQKAQGVVDLILIDLSATYGNLPYQSIIDEYQTDAGYIIIEPQYPLNQSISYVPYV
ncbi:MAG: hypothetical protein HPY79_11890 [Bacteroidales bacterium]|nr:hypothetical protein [Bacteroidales bacterium]